ncbi:hypothetical protein D8674_010691 [Pyrus ussuriensis x Pyrus communis]|uniref:CCHC-type domain-containing protein n=1 Tax=Pyrus ussuriensis x Pyrus communis TaxID=2448454 RepID=A0A5N5FGS4_9ROSA|nr:hypothetical protein D8674_010691 [Pyrus ussuriensis x Pyrus communis]
MATMTPCSTYQEFFEVLLRFEDFENASDDSDEEEETSNAQKNNNKDKGQQRNPNRTSAPLCRRCNNCHLRECKSGSGRCYTCGQTGHRANQWPQSQQKPQPPALPTAVPFQQIQSLSGYTPTSYGGAYHYQGDVMHRIRAVDRSGTLEDHLRTLMLLLALQFPLWVETGCYLGCESKEIVKEKMSGLSCWKCALKPII